MFYSFPQQNIVRREAVVFFTQRMLFVFLKDTFFSIFYSRLGAMIISLN